MRKGRADLNHRCGAQHPAKSRNILGQESETVHAGVELYMDRITGYAALLPLTYDFGQHVETEDFRLEHIGEQRIVVRDLWIHHHHGHGDARTAQLLALVYHSHGKIGRALALQSLGQLV